MVRPSKPDRPCVLPAEVWGCLSAEQRAKAIHCLAQLAFNFVKAQVPVSIQEANHVIRPDSHQNSRRPS
jgi:hypothetical protein